MKIKKNPIEKKTGEFQVSCLKRILTMQMLLLMLSVTSISGCAMSNKGQQYINVKPKVEPLSEEILRAMQADSTQLLKKGELWNESTGKLLDSVTDKSNP